MTPKSGVSTGKADKYPTWATELLQEHYDRIAEGFESKPRLGILDMLMEAYERGREAKHEESE